jgi:hypothetical protein
LWLVKAKVMPKASSSDDDAEHRATTEEVLGKQGLDEGRERYYTKMKRKFQGDEGPNSKLYR